MLPFVQIDCLLTLPEDGDKVASRIFWEPLTSTTDPMTSAAAIRVRALIGSSARKYPSNTATSGLT